MGGDACRRVRRPCHIGRGGGKGDKQKKRGAGTQPRVVPTHRRFLKIQRGLNLGLTDFKDAKGFRRMLETLRDNLSEAQGHFDKRVEAERVTLQEKKDIGVAAQEGGGWDLFARLGRFGLQSNDLAAAESLRRHRAERTIQRASVPLRT